MLWKCASFTFDCQRPVIMGVVNVTPDSFSDLSLIHISEPTRLL